MSYQRELDVARELGREAGAILLRHYTDGTEQWEKSKGNPVTLADLESDKHIREGLGAAFPDDAILSEETVDDATRVDNSRVGLAYVDPDVDFSRYRRIMVDPLGVDNVEIIQAQGGGVTRSSSATRTRPR